MHVGPYLEKGAELLKKTANSQIPELLERAIVATVDALKSGHPLLTCGNGGSAADSMHIAGELVGRFMRERKAYKCISLAADPILLTALGNDYGYDFVFSRQVEAYGEKDGIVFGLSTSGNSQNVIEAFKKAKEIGMTTIGFTGQGGGKLAEHTDILIDVPSRSTPEIQQVHVALYHYFCEEVEKRLCVTTS